jgi:hypothetical protein
VSTALQKNKGISGTKKISMASSTIKEILGTTKTKPSLSNLKITSLSKQKKEPFIQGVKQIKIVPSQKTRTISKDKAVSLVKELQNQNILQKEGTKSLTKTRSLQIIKEIQQARTIQKLRPLLKITPANILKPSFIRLVVPYINPSLRLIIFGKLSGNKVKLYSKSKPKQVYSILEKRGKKFYKLSGNLTFKDAKDRMAYRLDNKISRTAKIVPSGKSNLISLISKNERGYYSKNKKKFREFKIKRGQRKYTPLRFIEKRKYLLDKPGEKRQIRLNRVRKISFSQRKELLKRLEKARKVRMNKLRKG